jgi:hypothetical protein
MSEAENTERICIFKSGRSRGLVGWDWCRHLFVPIGIRVWSWRPISDEPIQIITFALSLSTSECRRRGMAPSHLAPLTCFILELIDKPK